MNEKTKKKLKLPIRRQPRTHRFLMKNLAVCTPFFSSSF